MTWSLNWRGKKHYCFQNMKFNMLNISSTDDILNFRSICMNYFEIHNIRRILNIYELG